jgi:hypothetical protein
MSVLNGALLATNRPPGNVSILMIGVVACVGLIDATSNTAAGA